MGNFGVLLPMLVFVVFMYIFLIRPQKKKEKEVQKMRSAIGTGDEIVTIGGIKAKVVKTKDETLVVSLGADKTKIEIMRWAVSKVLHSAGNVTPDETKEEETKKKIVPRRLKKSSDEKKEESTEEQSDK